MNTLEILEQNPLSREVLSKWFVNKLFESVKKDDGIPEDFKEFILNEEISTENLVIFINSNPRGLFDLFDEHDIVIETSLYPNGEFTIKIGNQATTNSWKTRREAEIFAIEAAFELLEQKLTENGKSNIHTTDSTNG
jgi:hypothetical protein